MFKVKEHDSKKKAKTYESCFILTIQPNLAYRTEEAEQEAKDRLKRVLAEKFAHFEDYITVKGLAKRAKLSLEDIVLKASVETQCEVGKVQHRVHSHSLVRLTLKKPHVHIDVAKLKVELAEEYGFPVHVHSRWLQSSVASIKNYINKEYTEH